MPRQKCVVLFSGGLDSRLAVKIMQERGFEILALHFNLPFGCGCCDFGCNFKFTQMSGVKFKIFDCARGKLLKEYLKVLEEGKHGRGAGFNPCRDCKIFMFKWAKKYADKNKIKVIATGEVLGQRPMSQTAKAMKLIDDEIGFELTRPLIELGISGRRRDKQMALAKKYKMKYPSPAGGCLLCEKELKKRFELLLGKNLINEKTLKLVSIGRHFWKDNSWFVVGRDEKENKVIEKFNTLPSRSERKGTSNRVREQPGVARTFSRPAKQASRNFIEGKKGKPAVYYSKKSCRKFAEELQEDFKTGGKKEFGGEKL